MDYVTKLFFTKDANSYVAKHQQHHLQAQSHNDIRVVLTHRRLYRPQYIYQFLMKTTLFCQRKQTFPYMETPSQFTHRTDINSLPKLKMYLLLKDDCRKFYTLRDDEKKLKFITNC